MSDLNESSQELIDIVVENKDQDDNYILGLLIGQGVQFNKAKGILNKILEEQGLRMTKAQRDDKAEELLASFEVSEETTAEEVAEAIEMLMDELGIKIGIARGYVKAMFTNEEIAYPKAVKASGPRVSTPGFKGDVKTAADFALAHPEEVENDKEVFKAYMDENGGSTTKNGTDKSGRWYSSVVDLRIFGKAWQDSHC